jgi:hypothetical protein
VVHDDQEGAVALFREFFNFNMVTQYRHKGENGAQQEDRQFMAEFSPGPGLVSFHEFPSSSENLNIIKLPYSADFVNRFSGRGKKRGAHRTPNMDIISKLFAGVNGECAPAAQICILNKYTHCILYAIAN